MEKSYSSYTVAKFMEAARRYQMLVDESKIKDDTDTIEDLFGIVEKLYQEWGSETDFIDNEEECYFCPYVQRRFQELFGSGSINNEKWFMR